ncbi:MAG: HAMP domain-containing protein [Deltaproteobacteria bacterium]|nr:HAMP domain-containing protein [Deltaproteobacteria bacterium]
MENRKQNDPPGEHRRRQRWEGLLILATALGAFLFASLQARLPQFSDGHNLANNVIFVLLIDLNIILLVLLVFLVGRNLIKLFYERQRKIVGSHLRLRLVLAFVAISLFPAILLFLIGVGFMTKSIENWFTVQVESALEGSLEAVNAFYTHLADEALFHGRQLATEIAEEGLLERRRQRTLQELLEEKQHEWNLGRVEIFSSARDLLVSAVQTGMPARGQSSTNTTLLERVLGNEEVREVQPAGEAEVVSGGIPIISHDHVIGAVVVEYFVPQSVAKQSAQVANAFREYRYLKVLKQPIKNNYTMTMALVTLVAVFSAIWIGLFLAKKIIVPLQQLAVGTREVAQGHWTHRIAGEGEDEVGTLVAAFNHMTEELQQSHQELEARRRYMEILLANINAGVVSVDRSGLLSTMNRAAEQLLAIHAAEARERDYREVFAAPEFNEVRRVVRDLLPFQSSGYEEIRGSQGQFRLSREGQVLSLLVSGTSLTDDRGEVLGLVCFFEDVTQIVRVERMEAWREVARRIAHEIKNPLTPIQLAAQRLHRRFAPQITENSEVFAECVQSIAQEVEAIKKLVNEFAVFARLPTADHLPQSLNALAQEVIILFAEAHKDLDFVFAADQTLPLLELDREGMKRVLRNLLDNAIAACRLVANGTPGRIEVTTRYLRSLGIARLEVADTGCGIPSEVKARLFEPYFSTKKEGTGLGLAIVATIVADHQAFIRVRDNEPQGSRFIIELPVRRSEQRARMGVEQALLPLTGTGGQR